MAIDLNISTSVSPDLGYKMKASASDLARNTDRLTETVKAVDFNKTLNWSELFLASGQSAQCEINCSVWARVLEIASTFLPCCETEGYFC